VRCVQLCNYSQTVSCNAAINFENIFEECAT